MSPHPGLSRTFTKTTVFTASDGTAGAAPEQTDMTPDKAALAAVMADYNEALNASSTDDCLALYADNGVFMPPFSPSSVGKSAVRQAYERVFRTITLQVKFNIAEIVVMSPEWAFVRTNSAGTNRLHATGAISVEGNQELFIFRKNAEGKWRIERYSFAPTNAPHA
jgi:uncharacterized protein (TIGR02246 family)